MVLEEQILRYYLSLFSILLVIIYIIFLTNINKFNDFDKIIKIKKGESVSSISKTLFKEHNFINYQIYFLSLNFINKFYSPINYGQFFIIEKTNFIDLIKIITKKSNINHKITIVEGWQTYQFNNYISDFYKSDIEIKYDNLLADTYIINSSNSMISFKNFLNEKLEIFFENYKQNDLLNKYGIKNILIISSLVEKEAKNNSDKGLISSVIFNRLNKNMKLQIDASVIFSITEGLRKFDTKLTLNDLKIKHPYNTYYIKGLPPDMICYVGPETVKFVLESPKSDFLFYFYNILENKHIFSKNYTEHIKKLNEYRSNK